MAGAEGDAAQIFEFVEAERADNVIGRGQPGAAAGFAMLDPANRDHVEYAHRAVPDDPFVQVDHAARFRADIGRSTFVEKTP